MHEHRAGHRETATGSVGALLLALLMAGLSTLVALPVFATNTAPTATLPVDGTSRLQPAGQGTYRWFGLHVYDARLWIDGERFDPARPLTPPFALSLTYARSLSGERIASTSRDEIQRLGGVEPDRLQSWYDAMRAIFPDVNAGDRLVGIMLTDGATRFVFNDRPIGQIDDPAFGNGFFAIWLDPRTRAPGLREALLGMTDGQRP